MPFEGDRRLRERRTGDRRRRHAPARRGLRRILDWRLFAILIVISGVALAATQLQMGGSGAASSQAEWLLLPPQSLLIDAGSPLDFSGLGPAGPAGSLGPLTLTSDHRLVFPGQSMPARFNCGMLGGGAGQTVALPTHEEADILATQLKRHGYTLMRLHNVDYRLSRYARYAGDIDPQTLDRFYYLTAALKRNGIYWIGDVLSQPSQGLSGADFGHGMSPDDLRTRLNFDPAARATWLQFVKKVYGSKNPYTGMTMLADPAMAFMVGANENSIGFAAKPGRPFPTGLAERFDVWLRQHYPTPAQLDAAVPDLSSSEKLGQAPVAPPSGWNETGPRMRLFLRFTSDLEVDTYKWMSEQLAKGGFRGPLLQDDALYKALDNRVRARLPIIDTHAYVGEVTSDVPGAQLQLPSVTEDAGLGAVLGNAAARWLDRPMVESEYSIPSPNPHRYEGGLIFPAVAAFQSFSAICRTAFLEVEPEIPPAGSDGKPLHSYAAGLDPNERAQETLSAMLFYRGDVRPATHVVAVPFGAQDLDRIGSAFIPLPIRRAALLARFGLISPENLSAFPNATITPLTSQPYTNAEKFFSRVANMATGSGAAETAAIVDDLRKKGALSPSNRTDPSRGIYQSETGEITVDQGAGLLSVVTPRTEAVSATNAASDLTLGQMTVRSLNGGALLAATALDAQPLADSRKILFIMTGDARNTGLQLGGDPANPRLMSWGHLPILMRRIVADIDLHTKGGHGGKLTVLSLQGRPILERTIAGGHGGAVRLRLDTGAVYDMPTTYFLYEPA